MNLLRIEVVVQNWHKHRIVYVLLDYLSKYWKQMIPNEIGIWSSVSINDGCEIVINVVTKST